MSRAVASCKVDGFKATGRDRTVISKAAKNRCFQPSADATGRLSQRQPSGVHQSSCCTFPSCKVEGFKATGRDRTVISKAAKRFFLGLEATLGSFPGHFWSVLGTKLGGVSAFRVVSMSRAVAADVKATGRDRTVISKAAKRSFFSRVSKATLGSFPGHFWSVLGTKLGGVSAFRVVSITQAVASCKVARLKVSKRRDATGRLSQRQPKDFFF